MALPAPIGDVDRASCLLGFVSHWIRRTHAVAWGASTCSAWAVADVARLTSIGAPALSRLGKPSGGSPTGESDVPHNPDTPQQVAASSSPSASVSRLDVNHAQRRADMVTRGRKTVGRYLS